MKATLDNAPVHDNKLARLRQDMRSRLGDNLQRLVLFGSRARGDARPDSDYDLLVLVNEVNRDVKDAIDDIAGEMLCEFGMVVSAFPTTRETVSSRKYSPLFLNVAKEGVAL